MFWGQKRKCPGSETNTVSKKRCWGSQKKDKGQKKMLGVKKGEPNKC